MPDEITIVDRGRGPQLSNCRITVQDLVPYLQRQYSHEQIIEIMPVLTAEQIQVIERYVHEHYQEVMEQDISIRKRNAQRQNPPSINEILRRGGEKLEALRNEFKKNSKYQERNGDPNCG